MLIPHAGFVLVKIATKHYKSKGKRQTAGGGEGFISDSDWEAVREEGEFG